jgi:hypothetical protein
VSVLVDPPSASRLERKNPPHTSLPHRIVNAVRHLARFAYDLLRDVF